MTLAKRIVTVARRVLALDIKSVTGRLLKIVRGTIDNWRIGKVVTLDIDSTAIRILEAGGGKVTKWASVSFEPDKGEEESVSGQSALGTMVKELMASNGIKAKKVIASVSGLYSVSRILSMPTPAEGVTMEEAVLEMARETMPLTEDRLSLSWQTIVAGEGEQQALVLGVPRDAVDDEARALKAVGINPHILELKAMALARAVNKKQALILNVEPSSFDIIVVAGGVPVVMRSIPWQPGDFTVEDKVEHLAVTMEITVGFYNSHHTDALLDPATPLFITGQVSGDLALVEKLQARLGYPVEPLAPPLECPVHLPIAQYAVNIGLALRGTAPSKNLGQSESLPLNINLLPDIYYPWRPSARQLYAVAAIIAAIVLLFPLFQVTNDAMSNTATLQARYTILDNELQRRKLEIKKREPLQKAIAEYNTIIDTDSHFTEDIEVIDSEAEKLGVQVEAITHQGDSIVVTCEADEGDYITFRAYKTALEESGRFSTPVSPPEGYPYIWRGPIKMEPVAHEPETASE